MQLDDIQTDKKPYFSIPGLFYSQTLCYSRTICSFGVFTEHYAKNVITKNVPKHSPSTSIQHICYWFPENESTLITKNKLPSMPEFNKKIEESADLDFVVKMHIQ